MASYLSVLGKIKKAISVATKGKFHGGPPCEFTIRDFDEHARNLDLNWQKVWANLTDVWDIMVHKGKITAAHKGWDHIASFLDSRLRYRKYSHLLPSEKYTTYENVPLPLQLWFVDEMPTEVPDGVVLCMKISPCIYEIPQYFRSIRVLQDFLQEPEIELRAWQNDFVTVTEPEPGKTGEIHFGSGTVATRKMWATSYRLKSAHEMIERFGSDTPYTELLYKEYRTYYDLKLMRYIQIMGPTIENLRMGLTIMNGWPYTKFKCQILDVDGNDKITVTPYPSLHGEYVIENNSGLAFKTKTGDNTYEEIKHGDIIEAFEPLVIGADIFDYYTEDIIGRFGVDRLAEHHTYVVNYNTNLDITGNEIDYENYAGPFMLNDKIEGQISGAWAILVDDQNDGLTGTFVVRCQVGAFINGETINDQFGHTATAVIPATAAICKYDLDYERNYAFLNHVCIDRYSAEYLIEFQIPIKPSVEIITTHDEPIPAPLAVCATDAPVVLPSPTGALITDAMYAIPEPRAVGISDYGMNITTPRAVAIADYGLLLEAPLTICHSVRAGWLPYTNMTNSFTVGSVLVGGFSGAQGIIIADACTGNDGKVYLYCITGTFEYTPSLGSGEPISDGFGSALVDGRLER